MFVEITQTPILIISYDEGIGSRVRTDDHLYLEDLNPAPGTWKAPLKKEFFFYIGFS